MEKFKAHSSLANAFLLLLASIFTIATHQYLQNHSLNIKFIIILTIIFSLILTYYLYMNSMTITFNEEFFTYSNWFETYTIKQKDIQSVAFIYEHKNVQSVFPFLHIQTDNKKIEIPSMMFEKDLMIIEKKLKKHVD